MSTKTSGEGKCNTADEYKHLADNQTLLNLKSIHCKRCGSKVIRESVAILTHDKKMDLPTMKKKNEESNENEESTCFWLLKNMMDFENVGFSNTVNDVKYLCCADCEVGPIGFHIIHNKTEFLVAADRVDYR
eukprot:Seg2610.2 transcript_id=Seg2610.2/GoldUCD/mRNA.D3Y31 product="Guanine nucleotide exchange factor MSS4" protein_id=Seg2610.2/GoldUCD/D3Y31